MTVKEFYDIVGGDYKTALQRMMNDDFIKRMLSKFIVNNAFSIIEQGFENQDAKTLFEGAHSLKGVSGNLALTRLFDKTCVVVEAVRDYEHIKEFDLREEMKELKDIYLLVKSNIEELVK